MRTKLRILWAFLAIVSLTHVPGQADENATRDRRHRQLIDQRQKILTSYKNDLTAVAEWCEEHQQQDGQQQVLSLIEQLASELEPTDLSTFVTPPVDQSLPLDEQQWRLQLRHHRETRAAELYTLARSTLRAGFPSLAFSIISDVLRVDPDHKYGRSVMGKQKYVDPTRKDEPGYAGEWVSAFEKKMRGESRPQVNHPDFGWIPLTSVPRYEQGLRPWKGDWISIDKEAELRRDFRNAWEVPSEHFLVKTNVSLEAGVELSRRLEIFHSWLQQNFAAFFDTPQSLQDRFEKATDRSADRAVKPMEVHYYATREEYQKRVFGKVPANLETNGLYWQPERTSYFYLNPARKDLTTLFHEATHQILDVNTTSDRLLAARARARKLKLRRIEDWVLCEHSNFWLIEGLACYFESFEIDENGQVSVGDAEYVRFDTARHRLLDPSFYFYMPSLQFFALGKDEFQKHPQVSPLYTQASGYVHFLMHYEDGLYRDDLIELLTAVYRPDAEKIIEEPSLTRIAGVSYDELDRQYREHMQNLDDLLNAGEPRRDQAGNRRPPRN